ncbi:hypothetical protein pb186bvf_008414 [Paramecium bursaria]
MIHKKTQLTSLDVVRCDYQKYNFIKRSFLEEHNQFIQLINNLLFQIEQIQNFRQIFCVATSNELIQILQFQANNLMLLFDQFDPQKIFYLKSRNKILFLEYDQQSIQKILIQISPLVFIMPYFHHSQELC